MTSLQHIQQYLSEVNQQYQSGKATEHSYRASLANIITALASNIRVINEPRNVTDCGSPDYVITRSTQPDIPVGYIEAKDIGKDLGHKQYKEQFTRYRSALDNLIITDYLLFQFFREGELQQEVRIAAVENGKIQPVPDVFAHFIALLQDFCGFEGQTITQPSKLAQLMAAKARLLQHSLEQALVSDTKSKAETSLQDQYKTFKDILISDLTPKTFADMYAQTLAYGMFAARLYDTAPESFSRRKAAELIPKSNPFLRKLFSHVAGPDIDERIRSTVDNLAEVFRATKVEQLLEGLNAENTGKRDPVIHFYETFLAAYNPTLRKSRGVWYTPEPVVHFMVRSIDAILKNEFSLKEGLFDWSKTTITVPLAASPGSENTQQAGKKTDSKTGKTPAPQTEERTVHTVQILDPAAGTGTFLAEIIRYVYAYLPTGQGSWSTYVDEHLIPRLNGFELLMAPYAMAHLTLDLLLQDTGYSPTQWAQDRRNIFLTNSLEEYHQDVGTMFSSWLSKEANEANRIKRDMPIMVVLGNPPYSVESFNKGKWIATLMEDYKREPGGKEKLQERNPKSINDDYVKFIRCGQNYIEKNGKGVMAFITPHGFLDNPTFRGMRWHLLQTFDSIYTIDLHGNARKKETAPDGSKDENVFDIQQGTAITFFIKTGRKKEGTLAAVYHHDLYGSREVKYQYLWVHTLRTVPYTLLSNVPPAYFMVPKDLGLEGEYRKGFALNELFIVHSVGIVTSRDHFTIHDSPDSLTKTIETFLSLSDEEARLRFQLGEDVKDWTVADARNDLQKHWPNKERIVPVQYRPFDTKYTFYTGTTKGFHCRPRNDVMQHFLAGSNIGMVFKIGNSEEHSAPVMVTKSIVDYRSWSRPGMQGGDYVAPLYTYRYPTWGGGAHKPLQHLMVMEPEPVYKPDKKELNLNMDIVQRIAHAINCTFVKQRDAEKEGDKKAKKLPDTVAPIDILDYIYAVLHSPHYRKTYQAFLKIDFPRVPYPTDAAAFWRLVQAGSALRKLHLLEADMPQSDITIKGSGDNTVTRKITAKDWEQYSAPDNTIAKTLVRVYINDTQYLEGIPLQAWQCYIGGYQPAQKWLKARYNTALSYDHIAHYGNIITALCETHRIMERMDKK